VERLTEIFEETANRPVHPGPIGQMFLTAREAYPTMLHNPGVAYRCGILALENVCQKLGAPRLNKTALHNTPSPASGFSIQELLALARDAGADLVARKRTSDEIVVPSIVHWKEGHFAAILEQHGSSYLVVDPTFGYPVWLEGDVINAECSGYFIAELKSTPHNWSSVSDGEAAGVRGRGFPNVIRGERDQPCEVVEYLCPCRPGALTGKGEGCTSCEDSPRAMPVWEVSEPFISLWVFDTPLWYNPSHGPIVELQVSYNQRDSDVIPGDVYNIGSGWRPRWLSWIDLPNTNHPGGMTLHQHGAVRYYENPDTTEYQSNTRMQLVTNTSPAHYELLYADGSKDIYSYPYYNLSTLTKMFLKERIDRFGFKIVLNYSTNAGVRLESIIDADNRTTTVSYHSTHSYKISQVKDPFNRIATFTYDPTGSFLTSITDIGGLCTKFIYDTNANNWLSRMETPYGTNTFSMTDLSHSNSFTNYTTNVVNRSVHVTLPSNGNHLFLYRENSSQLNSFNTNTLHEGTYSGSDALTNEFGPTGDIFNFNARNSWHWGPRQYANLSAGFRNSLNFTNLTLPDYRLARMRHWLHEQDGVVGNTLSIERAPSQDPSGSTWGKMTWYGYGAAEGYEDTNGTIQVGMIARRMPDGRSWVRTLDRDEWGRVTRQIETFDEETESTSYPPIIQESEFDLEFNFKRFKIGETPVFERSYSSKRFLTNLVNYLENGAREEVTQFQYNERGQLTNALFPSGLILTNGYFPSGTAPEANRLERSVLIGFATNTYTYETNGLVRTITDSRGLTMTYSWDSLQRLKRIDFPGDTFISLTYSNLDLVQIVDRNGAINQFEYNSMRELVNHTNELGRVTHFERCDCGALEWISDALTNVTSFSYDNLGQVTNILFPNGYRITHVFDSVNRPVYTMDNAGASVSRVFSLQDQLVALSTPAGLVLSNRFNREGELVRMVDAQGLEHLFDYDDWHRLLRSEIVNAATNVFEYSARGLTSFTDAFGKATAIVRDALGRATNIANPNDTNLVRLIYEGPNLRQLIDNKNQTNTWSYDRFGRMTNKVDHTSAKVLTNAYDAGGRLTRSWTPAKGMAAFVYDAAGNLRTNTTAHGNKVFTYDALNRLQTATSSDFGTVSFTYNEVGQVTSEDGPWPSDSISYGYLNGLRTNLTLVQPYSSPWVQTYAYDAQKRLTNIVSPAGPFGYVYSPNPSLLIDQLNLPGGPYIDYVYDLGRLTNTTLYSSTNVALNTHRYAYTSFRRDKQIFKDGNFIDYGYDDIGQLLSASGKESGGTARRHEQFGYQYDPAGNLKVRSNDALQQTFTVNALNQLSNVTRSGNITVAGFVTTNASVTVNSSPATVYEDLSFARTNVSITATYTAVATDSAGRTDTDVVTVNLPAMVSYAYDANGNLTSDGLRTFDYDDDNQLIRVAASDWETHFVYDAFLRRRAALHYKAATNGTTDFVKGAASLSSLIRSNSHAWVGAKFTVGPVPLVVTELGRWMLAGNSQTHTLRIARADGVDIASATVNMSGGTVGQFKYAALASPATLSAYTTYYLVSEEFINGDGWYSFDNELNTTSAATIDNMAYANTNNPNLFINGSHAGGCWGPLSFRYETDWNLVSETRYLYDGMLPIQERDARNVPRVTYTRGLDLSSTLQGAGGIGGLLARTDHTSANFQPGSPNLQPASAYYHADGSGNITALIDSRQIIAARYAYDPFGNLLAKSGPLADANVYRFSSKEYHAASGLSYYGYRYYDPNLQRWLNQDPIGELGGLNLYQSFFNSPGTFVDRNGLDNLYVTAANMAALSVQNAPVNGVIFQEAMFKTTVIPPPPVIRAPGGPPLFLSPTYKTEFLGYRYGAEFSPADPIGPGMAVFGRHVAPQLVLGLATDGLGNLIGRCFIARGGSSLADDLAAAATRARNTVGPGSGGAYGTRVHSAFEAEVKGLGNPNLTTEQSYLNGVPVSRGTPGSVRLDVVNGPVTAPISIFDLKTGTATLTPARIKQIQSHVPGGSGVPVFELRP
jgi:RHS repeat-associated protein